MSGIVVSPQGITDPPIDDLLAKTGSRVRPCDRGGQARPRDQRLLLRPGCRGAQTWARWWTRRTRRSRCRSPLREVVNDMIDVNSPATSQRSSASRSRTRSAPPRRRGQSLRRSLIHVPGGAPGSQGNRRVQGVRLLRRLSEAGHDVTVVPTDAALNFVGATTWAALSGNPVATGCSPTSTRSSTCAWVRLPTWCWWHPRRPTSWPGSARHCRRPAGQRAAHRLVPGGVRPGNAHRDVGAPGHAGQRRGAAPARHDGDRSGLGRLTGADSGAGGLPEAAELAATAEAVLAGGIPARDLSGRRVVVTAGEPASCSIPSASWATARRASRVMRWRRPRGTGVPKLSSSRPTPRCRIRRESRSSTS